MRDWFPNFKWTDLLALALLTGGMYLIAFFHGAVAIHDGVLPLAVVVAYVVFWRWRTQ